MNVKESKDLKKKIGLNVNKKYILYKTSTVCKKQEKEDNITAQKRAENLILLCLQIAHAQLCIVCIATHQWVKCRVLHTDTFPLLN